MKELLEVYGGKGVHGEIAVSGAKNAVLPMLMASLLSEGKVVLHNVPEISDVGIACALLEDIGAETALVDDRIIIQNADNLNNQPSASLMKSFRGSVWTLAPLVARTGYAQLALPGGDLIGKRKIDIHLAGLEAMGAQVKAENSVLEVSAPQGLKPIDFTLDFPSVGATHQLLMAAALTPGKSILRNVALEPEVLALAEMLKQMGAEIELSANDFHISGKESLGDVELEVIGDRIEAGTLILAGLATMIGKEERTEDLEIKGFNPQDLGYLLDIFEQMQVNYTVTEDAFILHPTNQIQPVAVETSPFPGLATDLQPQLLAVLCLAEGISYLKENIYESRFAHVNELNKMGACIQIKGEEQAKGQTAVVKPIKRFLAADVVAHDIRAGAAVLIAALNAGGVSSIKEVQHLKRGYYLEKFSELNARVNLQNELFDEASYIGC